MTKEEIYTYFNKPSLNNFSFEVTDFDILKCEGYVSLKFQPHSNATPAIVIVRWVCSQGRPLKPVLSNKCFIRMDVNDTPIYMEDCELDKVLMNEECGASVAIEMLNVELMKFVSAFEDSIKSTCFNFKDTV
ncbi:hypothetical protein [Piscirickettsia litoralis]|uniref:hypothetical protein n=1 Tax=Piscirickettsia litoralis TaxID=1891921 RepID=UPI001112D3CD|nr:hypothetical protein [Piscirickettsia litoralis]